MQRPRSATALRAEQLEARVNPVSFGAGYGSAVGGNAMSIAVGDVNGDGRLDMLAGAGENGVHVRINDGAGGFSVAANVPIGMPRSLELADMDGDGKLDILVGASSGLNVVIARGNGDGTFRTPIVKNVGVSAQDIAAADFNGDGKLDAVVASPGGAVVLLNDGSANILGAPTYHSPPPVPDSSSVTVGDFNGDGKPDFATAAYLGNRFDVYLNNGSGAFGTPTQNPNPFPNHSSHSGAITTGDFNNDGKLDLVVGYVFTGDGGIALGNGDGTFQTATVVTGAEGAIAPADFDADGNLDLAVTHFGSNRVAILLGDGTGAFAAPVFAASAFNPTNITVGDMNGDGLVDFITSGGTSPGGAVVTPNTTGIASSFSVSAPANVTAGDVFQIVVTAEGESGDTQTDFLGTIHLGSTDPQAELPPDYTFSSSDLGVKSFSVTLKTAGTWSITVTSGTATGSADVTVGHAQATSILVSTDTNTATAGEPITATVSALDAFGNIATSYTGTVEFTSSDPQADLPLEYTFSGADLGVKSFTVTLKTAGAQAVAATDTPNDLTSSASVTVEAAEMASLHASAPATATAGVPFAVTVTARDAFGNVATSYAETVAWTSTDPQAVLPQDGTIDDGIATFQVSLNSQGNWTVTVTDTASTELSATTDDILVSPALLALVADLGRHGLWHLNATGDWIGLSGADVETAAVSANGGVVVADLGTRGLRLWSVAGGWTVLSGANAEAVIVSADGGTVVADFGSRGLRRWTAGGWVRLAKANVQAVAVSADGTTVVADFGTRGIRRWTLSGGWANLLATDPERFSVSDDGGTVAADLGAGGLWRWTASTGDWVRLARANVESVVVSGDGTTLAADFGAKGLLRWTAADGWSSVTRANPDRVVISDDGGTIVADLGKKGLWRWVDGTRFGLTRADAQSVRISPNAAIVAGDFGARGLQYRDASWVVLTERDAEQIWVG